MQNHPALSSTKSLNLKNIFSRGCLFFVRVWAVCFLAPAGREVAYHPSAFEAGGSGSSFSAPEGTRSHAAQGDSQAAPSLTLHSTHSAAGPGQAMHGAQHGHAGRDRCYGGQEGSKPLHQANPWDRLNSDRICLASRMFAGRAAGIPGPRRKVGQNVRIGQNVRFRASPWYHGTGKKRRNSHILSYKRRRPKLQPVSFASTYDGKRAIILDSCAFNYTPTHTPRGGSRGWVGRG